MYIHRLFQRERSTPGRNTQFLRVCERLCNRNFCFCLFTGKRFKSVLGGKMGVKYIPARGTPAVDEDVQKKFSRQLASYIKERRQLWQGLNGESAQLDKRLLFFIFVYHLLKFSISWVIGKFCKLLIVLLYLYVNKDYFKTFIIV